MPFKNMPCRVKIEVFLCKSCVGGVWGPKADKSGGAFSLKMVCKKYCFKPGAPRLLLESSKSSIEFVISSAELHRNMPLPAKGDLSQELHDL